MADDGLAGDFFSPVCVCRFTPFICYRLWFVRLLPTKMVRWCTELSHQRVDSGNWFGRRIADMQWKAYNVPGREYRMHDERRKYSGEKVVSSIE